MTEPSQPKKILLVDDEDLVRKVCETALRNEGFDLIVTTNGVEALEVFTERHQEICLILSDVSMPKMSGLDLFRRILITHPRANVILMSGYSMDHIVPEDLRRLCSMVAKPFTCGTLVAAVKKCLRHDEERQPVAAPGADPQWVAPADY